MKRRVCSYDMFAVPDPSFVLKDIVGEDKTVGYSLTTPSGEYINSMELWMWSGGRRLVPLAKKFQKLQGFN